MKRKLFTIILIGAALALGVLFLVRQAARTPDAPPSGGTVIRSFSDDFSADGTLEEAGDSAESKDADWWLGSGAYFYRAGGVGRTVRGQLEADSKWQTAYAKNDPGETDGGFHPQNIFRLVTRSRWGNLTQQVYGRCVEYYRSGDEHRSASNGLLLFNRYRDEDNLYYAGVRVDGTAIIKKKVGGVYYTLASHPVFAGDYDRETNPNLLPAGWIGLRSEVADRADGAVEIKFYVDRDRSGRWELVLEARDDGRSYGGAALTGEGYAGIRTDFMDAEFDDYEISERG